eukprot:COSAG02_NODE_3464_length_6695_cov_12.759854_6_plen_177_part_00
MILFIRGNSRNRNFARWIHRLHSSSCAADGRLPPYNGREKALLSNSPYGAAWMGSNTLYTHLRHHQKGVGERWGRGFGPAAFCIKFLRSPDLRSASCRPSLYLTKFSFCQSNNTHVRTRHRPPLFDCAGPPRSAWWPASGFVAPVAQYCDKLGAILIGIVPITKLNLNTLVFTTAL